MKDYGPRTSDYGLRTRGSGFRVRVSRRPFTRSPLHPFIVLGLWSVVCGLWSLQAGPALPPDWQAYANARDRAAAVERADPRGAIAAWYSLFKEHPKLDAWIGVLGCSALVRLHYDGVHETKTALDLCDWAMKQYAGSPALARVVADKADLLLREKRPAEAEALVAANWDLVARSYYAYTDAAVRQYYLSLERQSKERDALGLLGRALREMPQLLDEAQQSPPGWIYNRLVHSLVARGQADEALSWAKARFATCRYEPAAMERSGRALIGAWAAKDPARKDARRFLSEIQNPKSEIPNPLAAVPMPPVERKAVTEILTRLQGGAQLTHDRVGLHLLAGNVREAVAEARRLITDSPEQPAGALELCRVLKALELSPARANALLSFLKEGAGADPLPAALQPYGLGTEPLSAEARAVQRTALAKTPLVLADALADAIGRPAPLPETATAAGLPATMPLPAPADIAALLPAGPAPVAVGPVPVAPVAIPMPGLAPVQVALPTWGAPRVAGAAVPVAVPVAGGEGVRPVAVAAVPAGTGFRVPAAPSTPAIGAPAAVGVPVAGTGGIGPAPTPGQPAVVAAPAGIALPTPVSENTAGVAVALARLAAGEITPEAAWEEGKLTADDVLRSLEALPIWGQDAYANALTSLLVAHCPDRAQDMAALSAKLRVSLARYYSSTGDGRCVPLWDALLCDPATDAYVEMASAGLSEYHRAAGDYARAAKACLEGQRRSRNPAVRANCLVEAARYHLMLGEDYQAAKLYAQVAQHGYGWATGLALVDQARWLLKQGKHERARELLRRPVTGKYADQIGVAVLGLLGESYYLTGEFVEAKRYCHEAIEQYRSLPTPLRGEGLEAAVSDLEARVHWISRWERSSICCEPDELVVGPGATRQALKLLTPRRIALAVRSKSGAVLGMRRDVELCRSAPPDAYLDFIVGNRQASDLRRPMRVSRTVLLPTTSRGKHVCMLMVDGTDPQAGWRWSRVPIDAASPPDSAVRMMVDAYRVCETQLLSQSPAAARRLAPITQSNEKLAEAYLAPDACSSCHAAAYGVWHQQSHARAVDTLRQRGRTVPECLACHSERYRRTGGIADAAEADGVQCSTCHGPGVIHRLLRGKGGITRRVDEATCKSCHNQDRDPRFDYAQALQRIRHW